MEWKNIDWEQPLEMSGDGGVHFHQAFKSAIVFCPKGKPKQYNVQYASLLTRAFGIFDCNGNSIDGNFTLRNKEKKHNVKFYVNVFSDDQGSLHFPLRFSAWLKKEEAENDARNRGERIACLKIESEFEEGEGI